MMRVVLVVGLLTSIASAPRTPQGRTDFSGTWTLVNIADDSAGRGGASSSARPRTSNISGPPINCRDECTIVQTDATLTVSLPPSQQGGTLGSIEVKIDGTPMPGGSIAVKWDGGKLVLERHLGSQRIEQTLALSEDKLVIRDVFATGNVGPVTLTYKRKTT